MAALNRRERSLVGLGLAALLGIGTYLYVIEPVLTRQRETAEITPAREATLEHRRLLIAQRERLTSELDALASQVEEASKRLLVGPTAPLAASELQKLTKELAAGATVEVRSERVLPTTDVGGLQEIPIELTVAGTIREIVTLLSQLERANRLLTVKDIKIRVVARGQPRELLTTLIVAGYLRPGTVPSKPAEAAAPPRST